MDSHASSSKSEAIENVFLPKKILNYWTTMLAPPINTLEACIPEAMNDNDPIVEEVNREVGEVAKHVLEDA